MVRIEFERKHFPWQSIAAVACFVTSVLAGASGTVLTTRWLLSEQLHPWLHAVGLILLIVSLPILILGGHFLDLTEENVDPNKIHHSAAYHDGGRARHDDHPRPRSLE